MPSISHGVGKSVSLDYFDAAVLPGNSSVDAGPALQDACDAIAAGDIGEIVGFGTYYIETPVVMSDPSKLRIRAIGGGGAMGGPGAFNLNIVGSIVGLTLGASSGDYHWRGPVLDNVTFVDDTPGTATGALRLLRLAGAHLFRPSFQKFSAGYGLLLDGGSNSCQHVVIEQPAIDKCAIGIKANKQVEDILIRGGHIYGDSSDATPDGKGIAPDATNGMWGRWLIDGLNINDMAVAADLTGLRRSHIHINAEQHAPSAAYGTAVIIDGWGEAAPDGSTTQGHQNRIDLTAYRFATGLSVGSNAVDTEYRVVAPATTTAVNNSGGVSDPAAVTKSANW